MGAAKGAPGLLGGAATRLLSVASYLPSLF